MTRKLFKLVIGSDIEYENSNIGEYGFVSGPGEGDEVWIIEVRDDGTYDVVERYENPAKYAQQVRGGIHAKECARTWS